MRWEVFSELYLMKNQDKKNEDWEINFKYSPRKTVLFAIFANTICHGLLKMKTVYVNLNINL